MNTRILAAVALLGAGGITGYVAWSNLDTGLANSLGIRTLRHGTGLYANCMIHLVGAKPRNPGSTSGSTRVKDPNGKQGLATLAKTEENPKGAWVYAWKDAADDTLPDDLRSAQHLTILRIKRNEPRQYAFFAGMGEMRKSSGGAGEARTVTKVAGGVGSYLWGVASLVFSPTVLFRFTKAEQEAQFVDNPAEYQSPCALSLVTSERIGPWRVGTIGTLFTAVKNPNLFRRIKDEPGRFLTGIVQLMIGAGLAYATYRIALVAKRLLT